MNKEQYIAKLQQEYSIRQSKDCGSKKERTRKNQTIRGLQPSGV